jgi:amidase
VWFAHLAHQMATIRERWDVRTSDFELDSLAMEAIAKARSAPEYAASYVRFGEYGCQLAEFLTRYDVYMTPTLAAPPPAIGRVTTPPWAAGLMRAGMPLGLARLIPLAAGTIESVTLENLRGIPFTQLANVTGVPAMSVPLHTFPSGLPLGIHFLADHGGEGLLLSLASQLEQAAPWQARRPSLEG